MSLTDGPNLNNRVTKEPREKPRPSAHHGTDSAEITSVAPVPTKKPAAARPSRQPVIQLNTRIELSYRELIDDVVAQTGQTVRSVIEEALAYKYGDPKNMR